MSKTELEELEAVVRDRVSAACKAVLVKQCPPAADTMTRACELAAVGAMMEMCPPRTRMGQVSVSFDGHKPVISIELLRHRELGNLFLEVRV